MGPSVAAVTVVPVAMAPSCRPCNAAVGHASAWWANWCVCGGGNTAGGWQIVAGKMPSAVAGDVHPSVTGPVSLSGRGLRGSGLALGGKLGALRVWERR